MASGATAAGAAAPALGGGRDGFHGRRAERGLSVVCRRVAHRHLLKPPVRR